MSFLAGRLAGKEGAYFLQESKQAVSRILENQKTKIGTPIPENSEIPSADVLPEVLRHSLPSKIFYSPSQNSTSSFSDSSKWVFKSDPNRGVGSSVSPDALNPLRAYVSLPQVTFGPKRWQLPNVENSVLASTANDLRNDKYNSTIDPDKLKAAAAGLSHIGSAFAVATAVVFGGSAVIFGLTASKLEMHSSDDIRNKGKDMLQPKLEMFKEQLIPLRTWADDLSKKWHFERKESSQEKSLIKELSRSMGAKTST